MNALARISYPAVDNTWAIISSVFSWELDIRTHVGGFGKWNMWLLMTHWICIRTPIWAPLTKAWLTMGQSTNFLSPKPVSTWDTPPPYLGPHLAGTDFPLLQKGTLKLPLEYLTKGFMLDHKVTLLLFLTFLDTKDHDGSDLGTTKLASTWREGWLCFINIC